MSIEKNKAKDINYHTPNRDTKILSTVFQNAANPAIGGIFSILQVKLPGKIFVVETYLASFVVNS
jgi:hypothetical protein